MIRRQIGFDRGAGLRRRDVRLEDIADGSRGG